MTVYQVQCHHCDHTVTGLTVTEVGAFMAGHIGHMPMVGLRVIPVRGTLAELIVAEAEQLVRA